MFSMAVDGLVATAQETGHEQLPSSPHLALAAEPQAATQRGPLRPLAVGQCSLCGIALPLGLLVPDGGQACADVRWYCKDAKSCTERWTAAPPRPMPAVPGQAIAGAGEPASDAAPAGQPDGTLEEAHAAG
jgi:hypothetical protein